MSGTPATKSFLDYIPNWLPVAVAIFGVVAFGVRADAQISELNDKTVQYDKMMIERTDRMARVEEQLKAQSAQLSRIERLLEDDR